MNLSMSPELCLIYVYLLLGVLAAPPAKEQQIGVNGLETDPKRQGYMV